MSFVAQLKGTQKAGFEYKPLSPKKLFILLLRNWISQIESMLDPESLTGRLLQIQCKWVGGGDKREGVGLILFSCVKFMFYMHVLYYILW